MASMSRHATGTVHAGNEQPAMPIGMPALIKMAFDGADLAPVWNSLVARVNQNPDDAGALIDLSTIALVQGRPDDRASLQDMALKVQRIYRQQPVGDASESLRVLAFLSPGVLMDNMPVEFLLEHSNVSLDMVYVAPGLPLPDPLPPHDVALVCVSESRENQALLRELSSLLASWPRPVVNRPDRIGRLTRVGTWELLKSVPEIVIPVQVQVEASRLKEIALGEVAIEAVLDGHGFPMIARPVDSHAGEGLAKLSNRAETIDYLSDRREDEFCIAPFIDYRSKDGLFRKYRIALIDGHPYAVHMAVSQHWMVHYLNADMKDSAAKRAEEARFMADFDKDFAVRHNRALDAIGKLTGLEYLPFDCGETGDGKLLVFETGTNMIVHSMDPVDLFPYKPPQMEKVFGAFQSMLRKRSGLGSRNGN
jgi:hypothetical protein